MKGVCRETGRNWRFKDETGNRFGRLTVISFTGLTKGKMAIWNCVCDCGGTANVAGSKLRNGHTVSCGCFHREIARTTRLTHGKSHTTEHTIWNCMLDRCRRPENEQYPNYGGRGIKVCEQWMKFENFFADMGPRPKGKMLDRKDCDGNYEPDNCRWVTPIVQANNKRNNRTLTIQGRTQTVADWARERGVVADRVYRRLYRGKTPEQALKP